MMHKTCYLFRSAISDQFVRSELFLVGTNLHFELNFGTTWRPFFLDLIETNQLFSLNLLKCFCDVFWVNIITGVVNKEGERDGGKLKRHIQLTLKTCCYSCCPPPLSPPSLPGWVTLTHSICISCWLPNEIK